MLDTDLARKEAIDAYKSFVRMLYRNEANRVIAERVPMLDDDIQTQIAKGKPFRVNMESLLAMAQRDCE